MFGIPEKTFALVLALAESYGHLWARYAREEGAPQEVEAFREFVCRRANEDGDTGPGGIPAPAVLVVEDGDFSQVRHTTGSGRLEWVVWDDAEGNPVVNAFVHRPGVEEVLEVHPDFDAYGLRHKAGDFGQRHLRALRGFLEVALPHVPALEPVLGRLAELEGEARKHDALEAQHLLWSTPLEELQWAKPALEDALGNVLASEAAQEFAVLLRAVNAARERWANLVAQHNFEQTEA